MRNDLPNKHTQSVMYHTRVRNCALIMLIAQTGYRRNTIRQLNYTGDHQGHLRGEEAKYVLTVPRSLFKVEDSSYFGPKDSQDGSHIELLDVLGLNDILSEYLNGSRSYLLNKYFPECKETPLFVSSVISKNPRMSGNRISNIYLDATGRHLVENKYRGTGLAHVRPHRPHSARHIRGTTIVKKTGDFQIAGDANQHTECTARKYYANFKTNDRNRRVKRRASIGKHHLLWLMKPRIAF